MIKNVVFDLGQVLIAYEPVKYLESLGFNSELTKELYELIFYDKVWQELDRGAYSFSEAIAIFKIKKPFLSNEIDKIFQTGWLDSIFSEKQESVEFMKSLIEHGYSVYFLSNFAKESYEYAEKRFPFLHLPHGKIISYRENCIKPEPEIYEILLDRYNLVPEETVFFDDLINNINAARDKNINAILFNDIKQAKEEFNLLINNNN